LRAKTCFPSEFLYPPEMRFHQETDRMWIVPQIPTPSRLASCSEMLWFCKRHSTSPGTQRRPGSPHITIAKPLKIHIAEQQHNMQTFFDSVNSYYF